MAKILVELVGGSNYTCQTGIGRYVESLKQDLHKRKPASLEIKSKKPYLLPISKHLSFLRQLPLSVEGHESGHIVHFPQIMGCAMLLWNNYHPSVATVHDLGVLELPAEWKMLDPIARQILRLSLQGLKKASLIVTDSEFTRQGVIKHLAVPAERVVTVHLGIDQARFRPIPEARQQLFAKYPELAARPGKWLLYVGSELPRKNLTTALSALAKVKQTHPDILLLKVGSAGGERFRLETQSTIERLGLEETVQFMGRIPDEELALFYAASDLLVQPSKLEGFGFPVLEAMACGTPVVVSNKSSLPELVGDAAILFDPQRQDEMATAIRRVLEDKNLSLAMRAEGIKQAAKFTWQETARQMVDVYKSLYRGGYPRKAGQSSNDFSRSRPQKTPEVVTTSLQAAVHSLFLSRLKWVAPRGRKLS